MRDTIRKSANRWNRKPAAPPALQTWQFNWRMYCAVRITAATEAEAREIALSKRPSHVPEGTELMHYGLVRS